MAYADIGDVRLLDRELDPDDDDTVEWVDALLDLAEGEIRLSVPDLDARVAAGTSDIANVRRVEAEMVSGVTRNPNAWTNRSENTGSLSEGTGWITDVASGLLVMTERHRNMILGQSTVAASSSGSGGAFTIRPGGRPGSF